MKKLLLLLFSLILSFNSYGEWTYIGDSNNDVFFMDLDTVKDSNGHVYWWYLINLNESNNDNKSQKVYIQGDCEMPRIKTLTNYFYNKTMGEDLASYSSTSSEWVYLPPDTAAGLMLDISCGLSKKAEELSPEKYQEYVEILQLLAQDNYLQVQLESIANNLEEIQAEEDLIENQASILQSAWIRNIAAEVKSVWNFPGAEDGWFVEVLVIQNKEGKVLNVKTGDNNVGNSSQAKRFIDSVERAVYKASPLPIAPDASVWQKDILFTFYP